MRVDSAEAKSVDRSAPGGLRFPWLGGAQDAERPAVVPELRRRPFEIRGRRQSPVTKGQEHLRESRGSCARQQVADGGLDPAQDCPTVLASPKLAQTLK